VRVVDRLLVFDVDRQRDTAAGRSHRRDLENQKSSGGGHRGERTTASGAHGLCAPLAGAPISGMTGMPLGSLR
jgi:hypothetical protein